ncbi:MAG: hypothetical protein QM679_03745, partial [Patulibacter sp.]
MGAAAVPGAATLTVGRCPLERSPSVAQLAAVIGERQGFILSGRWGLPEAAPDAARVLVAGVDPAWTLGPADDPFAALDRLPRLHHAGAAEPGVIGGGLIGWLGFGLSRTVEATLGPQPPRPHQLPNAPLAWYDDLLRRDEHGAWWVE